MCQVLWTMMSCLILYSNLHDQKSVAECLCFSVAYSERPETMPVYLGRHITTRHQWVHFALLFSSAAVHTIPHDYFLGLSFLLHCSYHLELSATHCDSCRLTGIF